MSQVKTIHNIDIIWNGLIKFIFINSKPPLVDPSFFQLIKLILYRVQIHIFSYFFPAPLWALTALLVVLCCKTMILCWLVAKLKRYSLALLVGGCVEARFFARFWSGNIGNTKKMLGMAQGVEFYDRLFCGQKVKASYV